MTELIPSLLVESRDEFERRLRLVEHDVETIHVDILDGTLFPNTTWFDARAVGAMSTRVKYELHLMVENPLPIIKDWKRHVEQTHRAIVHAEIPRPIGAVVSHITDLLRLEAGAALNPETPLREIHPVLAELAQVTVMGVHPGSSGQGFLGESILQKIREIRNHAPNTAIEIDGGVTPELMKPFLDAGVTRMCAASAIFSAADPLAALRKMKSLL